MKLNFIEKFKLEEIVLNTQTNNNESINLKPISNDYIDWLSKVSYFSAEKWEKHIEKYNNDKKGIIFILESNEKPFGEVTLHNIDKLGQEEGELERVYRWEKDFAKGGMTEGIKEITRFAFENVELNKIWLNYFEDNIKAKNLYENCGFKTVERIPLEKHAKGWIENHSLEKAERYFIKKEITPEILKYLDS